MEKFGIVACFFMMTVMAAAAAGTPTLSPTPAPAPAPTPPYVNLTDLFSLAGPFETFLGLLQSTGMLKTVQDQANNTDEGVTIFAPSDPSFASLKKSVLGNLTADQKKALVMGHVISKFYSLQDFQNYSNPANTMATGVNGGKYNLNITAKSGAVSVSSGYVTAPIASTVHVTYPVAVYTIPKVLLPEDIFGLPSPVAPTPAPDAAPVASPDADGSPSGNSGAFSSPVNSPKASSTSAASFLSTQHPISILLLVAGALYQLL